MPPTATGTEYIATRKPYRYASGVLLKSNMLATIAQTVFITNSEKGRLLVDYTGARQQQIAEVLKASLEGC